MVLVPIRRQSRSVRRHSRVEYDGNELEKSFRNFVKEERETGAKELSLSVMTHSLGFVCIPPFVFHFLQLLEGLLLCERASSRTDTCRWMKVTDLEQDSNEAMQVCSWHHGICEAQAI
jgi:hypothetical protein